MAAITALQRQGVCRKQTGPPQTTSRPHDSNPTARPPDREHATSRTASRQPAPPAASSPMAGQGQGPQEATASLQRGPVPCSRGGEGGAHSERNDGAHDTMTNMQVMSECNIVTVQIEFTVRRVRQLQCYARGPRSHDVEITAVLGRYTFWEADGDDDDRQLNHGAAILQ